MNEPLHRVAVIGAGAMGTLFAARIAETGREVVLVDIDRARLEAIATWGVRIVDDAGARAVPVATATAEQLDPRQDLVLVFTKSAHTRAAVASIAHLVDGEALVLTLQNGLGNPEAIADRFPAERVLTGVAFLPADLGPDGEVRTTGTLPLALGPLVGTGADAARAVADLLVDSGFEARVSDDIDAEIWRKLAFNVALNPLGAVLGMTNGELDNTHGRRIADGIVAEVVATAHALGIDVDAHEVTAAVADALVAHADHEASMLQDVKARRRTEIDALAGAVCERAAEVGVATPITQVLADLVRLVETRGSAQAVAPN